MRAGGLRETSGRGPLSPGLSPSADRPRGEAVPLCARRAAPQRRHASLPPRWWLPHVRGRCLPSGGGGIPICCQFSFASHCLGGYPPMLNVHSLLLCYQMSTKQSSVKAKQHANSPKNLPSAQKLRFELFEPEFLGYFYTHSCFNCENLSACIACLISDIRVRKKCRL